jgi:hypothetical protein
MFLRSSAARRGASRDRVKIENAIAARDTGGWPHALKERGSRLSVKPLSPVRIRLAQMSETLGQLIAAGKIHPRALHFEQVGFPRRVVCSFRLQLASSARR